MYFVYIMANRSGTLYTGVTNNLDRRVWEHKNQVGSEFTCKYKVDRLVYFERWGLVQSAIKREKEIKGWRRSKKLSLIIGQSPGWRDLAAAPLHADLFNSAL